MKKRNLLLIIPVVLLIVLLKSCTSSRTSNVDNSTNEQLLKRVGELEDENKELKSQIAKLKDDNNILKSSQNVETKSIEKSPTTAKETSQKSTVDDKLVDDFIWKAKVEFENSADIETEMDGETLLVHMYPKNDLANELKVLIANPTNQQFIDSWVDFTMNLVYVSATFYDKTNQDVEFIIHDPDNKYNILFSSHNNYESKNFIDY